MSIETEASSSSSAKASQPGVATAIWLHGERQKPYLAYQFDFSPFNSSTNGLVFKAYRDFKA